MDKVDSKKAIILGNGESRLGFDYRKEFPDAFVYGCNGAYKEKPDALVVSDVGMQPIVYNTGYCKDNLCYFPEWERIPGDMVEMLVSSMGNTRVVENERGNRKEAVVSGHAKDPQTGSQHITYVTWVDDEDKVVKIQEICISSGSRALLHACESNLFNEIYLIGFDGMGALNIYQHDRGYENSTPRDIWIQERENIKSQFPNIKFYDL